MATESLGDRNRRQQAEFAKGISGSVNPVVSNIGGTPPVIAPITPPTITPTSPITKQDYSFMGADNSPMQGDIAPVVPPSSVSAPQAPTVAQTPQNIAPVESL